MLFYKFIIHRMNKIGDLFLSDINYSYFYFLLSKHCKYLQNPISFVAKI